MELECAVHGYSLLMDMKNVNMGMLVTGVYYNLRYSPLIDESCK